MNSTCHYKLFVYLDGSVFEVNKISDECRDWVGCVNISETVRLDMITGVQRPHDCAEMPGRIEFFDI